MLALCQQCLAKVFPHITYIIYFWFKRAYLSSQEVIDVLLCMVAGCALGTGVCHWMFIKGLTWFKVNKIIL